MTDIILVNQSTVLSDDAVKAVVPALQAQVTHDWLPHWPGRDATIHFASASDPVPPGYWPLYILDNTDVPGAGGYHDDDTGTPSGKVFAADAMMYGEAWTVDCSHELLEMLGDPSTRTLVALPHGLHCLQEVCDAVEADRYGYERDGVLLTDFCLPAYFSQTAKGPFDFKAHLGSRAPGLLHGGYLGIELPDGMWTQIVKRDERGLISRRAVHSHRTAHRVGA